MSDEDSADKNLQWLVPEAEAQPVWDLFQRVFRIEEREYGNPFGGDPPFFVNTNWTVLGLVNDLEGVALPPYAPEEVRDGRLSWEQWRSRLENLEYVERAGFYERDELGPLLDIMAGEGAQTLYFTDVLRQVPGPIQAGAASRDGLREAVLALFRSQIGYGVPLNFVFDDTGRWGLYIDEDDIAFLAAEPDLMRRYLPEVGGLEVLQQRFADRVYEGADPEGKNYWTGAVHAYRLWYAYMRWPWPFPKPPLTIPERAGQAET